MPPLATTVLDEAGVSLVSNWITNDLPATQDFSTWQRAFFGSTNLPAAAPQADPDQDGASNSLEYLTGGSPLDPGDAWKIRIQRSDTSLEILFPQIANRSFQVQVTTNAASPATWRPLDVPDNRPFFAATNRIGSVHDLLSDDVTRFYRVLVSEP
jgi:hypothetical protein